jgi:TM2 domain-containing membrane protein YozV
MSTAPKSKVAFILLAVFLGHLGIHNFYLGNTKRAIIQLLVTLLTCGIGGIAMWIWAIIEAITVRKDLNGVDFN